MGMFSTALEKAVSSATKAVLANVATESSPPSAISRIPSFNINEYKSSENISVADYFNRFDWALQLSRVDKCEYQNYALVHMGTELNNSLKILVSPRAPEDVTYEELKSILTDHFDQVKKKYAESVKFRLITQEKEESIANFALRLKQGAAFCDYGQFLDRMLIEQLLFGLHARDICDEIIVRKPDTFKTAYDIAHTLEATRKTSLVLQTPNLPALPLVEETNKLVERSSVRSKQNIRFDKEIRKQQKCHGCGGNHFRNKCKFLEADCHSCGKKGHIAKVCRGKVYHMSEEDAELHIPSDTIDSIHTIETPYLQSKKLIEVQLNKRNVFMELDTGAPCSIISEKTLRNILPSIHIQKSNRQFASYTKHKIECLGRVSVNVTVKNKTKRLNLYVVKGDYDSLFGREWIGHFTREINFVKLFENGDVIKSITTSTPKLDQNQVQRLESLLSQYPDVFSDTPGKLSGPPAELHLKPGVSPVFSKPRDIPLALRDAYAKEIETKLASGLYKRVDYSEWASTTHVVSKKNGKIRITGNYKPTLNPRMIIDEHPLPRTEFLFNKLRNTSLFCHLDITDAYSHLVVSEEFGNALTLNTPTHGLIRPCRAVYGAANIPAIWQRRMETVLQGVNNVLNFFDDILVYADNFENLIESLKSTLDKIRAHGLKLNRSKCVFASPSIEFLGHRIDAQGIHKSDKHIKAVKDAPKPTSSDELQLFLGKASYYGAYISHLSSRSRPLRDMLQKEPFKWTKDAETAYIDIKNALISPEVLMPYDPSLPLLLATDASKTGLGAVLSHKLNDGHERPIAYASRTLTTTEQRYPQMDKEALAIVWAVQKFFTYLYARHWTLITDHKPLSQILHPEKSLPVLCISRMANYADFLSNFDYDVLFKSTKENINADFCSRAISWCSTPVNTICETTPEYNDSFDSFIIQQITQLPVRAHTIACETRKDTHLSKILKAIEQGQCLKRAGYKAPEVSYKLAAGCLLFEHRVVIPESIRKSILTDLHAGHLGIVKMKGLARSFVFWPGIDHDIEQTAKSCFDCARFSRAPPQYNEHHWEYPKAPWERIHVDYAGPIFGSMLLIVTDAFSKWLEVKITQSASTAATVRILDELFATYGVPTTIVSDNGTCFTSVEFKEFLKNVGVKFHKRIAPYHPATNGQAERYVQTVKNGLKAMNTTSNSLQSNLNIFLRQYRKSPHSTTGQSPSWLFLGRELRSRLNLVIPDDICTKITQKQQLQCEHSPRSFYPSQNVIFLSGNPRMDRWIQGTIVRRLGDLHYEINFRGRLFKRHINQIQPYGKDEQLEFPQIFSEPRPMLKPDKTYFHFNESMEPNVETTVPGTQSSQPMNGPSIIDSDKAASSSEITVKTGDKLLFTPRRSTRPRKPKLIYSP